jgi:Family of unknown function (DUF6868)
MDIQTVQSFFMWCTILNGIMLVISFLICSLAGDWVYRRHSQWFPVPRESFNLVIYGLLGLSKTLWFMFNLVPALVLGIAA